jgi:hypothetical protein
MVVMSFSVSAAYMAAAAGILLLVEVAQFALFTQLQEFLVVTHQPIRGICNA